MWVKYRNKIDHLEGTLWIKALIDELNPARVNVDMGNIGSAIVTSLKACGPRYAALVRGVNFGGTSEAKFAAPKRPGPHNRRAEMWQRAAEWLMPSEGASIPDDDALQTDLTAPRLKPRLDNDFLLESKAEMKARGVRSPDLADALVLTFAFNEFFQGYQAENSRKPVFASDPGLQPEPDQSYIPPAGHGSTSWMG